MKTIIFFSLMITTIILGCDQPKGLPMEGTWQVVSWQNFVGDSIPWQLGVNVKGSEYKIWTKDHFSFVGRFIEDTTEWVDAGTGSFKLEGTHYEEDFIYCSFKDYEGTKVKVLLEIKNDTLTQTWPVDDNWQVIKKDYHIQKLIRLK